MRLLSLSISACLFALALFFVGGLAFPRVAHAQVAGVTCSMIQGVYTCTDGSTSGGNVCITDNTAGTTSCYSIVGGGSSGNNSSVPGIGQVQKLPPQQCGKGWLSQISCWFANTYHIFFSGIVNFAIDLVTYVFHGVFSVVSAAINSIPVPSWVSQYSLGSLLSQTGPVIGFFITQFQVGTALAVIGLGYGVRLLRKFVTLFQW